MSTIYVHYFFSILWLFHFIIKIPNAFISLYIDDDQRSILIINTNSFRQPFSSASIHAKSFQYFNLFVAVSYLFCSADLSVPLFLLTDCLFVP